MNAKPIICVTCGKPVTKSCRIRQGKNTCSTECNRTYLEKVMDARKTKSETKIAPKEVVPQGTKDKSQKNEQVTK